MSEYLNITEVRTHQHPLSGREIHIANMPNVWPPYSAFHLAERTLPLAHQVATRNGHQPLVLDIGTGSGILPVLAKQTIPDAVVVATDLNPAATQLATHNWNLNDLPPGDLTTMVADGISRQLIQLIRNHGRIDVLYANLPQQPLVKGEDLARLRKTQAAAWNVDPSRDPNGLGIFQKVLSKTSEVMTRGGIALVSASSKQGKPYIEAYLNGLVKGRNAKDWHYVSATRFDVPNTYGDKLIHHWKEMEKNDGVTRLFQGANGQHQYDHYNIAVEF